MKKRSIVFCALALLTAVVLLGFAVNASGAYPVYYGKTVRKLPVYSVGRDDKKIAISFDCAWGTEHTDAILAAMEKFNVKCTFFAVEFWVKKYPDYVKKITEKGHELGTHGATHSHMAKMKEADILKELETSKKAIEDITGKKTELFRPPFGEYDDLLIECAEKSNLMTIQWNVDSLDWKDLSAEEIANRVIAKVKSGSIILCHNNGLHTAESLPLIFAALKQKGYEFVPISKLVYKQNYTIDSSGKQILSE